MPTHEAGVSVIAVSILGLAQRFSAVTGDLAQHFAIFHRKVESYLTKDSMATSFGSRNFASVIRFESEISVFVVALSF